MTIARQKITRKRMSRTSMLGDAIGGALKDMGFWAKG
jgi:hypothetical protein